MAVHGTSSACSRQFQTNAGLANIAPTSVRSVESPGHRRAHNACLGYCDNFLPLVSSMCFLHPGCSKCNTIGGLCSPEHGQQGPLLHILHCSFPLESNLSLRTMLVSLRALGGAAVREHLFESVGQASSLTAKLQKTRLGYYVATNTRIRQNDFQSRTSYELPKVRGSRHMGSAFYFMIFVVSFISPLSPCSLLLSSVRGEKNPSTLTFLEPVAPGLSGPPGFW